MEASYRYNKHEQHTADNARAINDERGAVYSEIQSLWDEMVPLAHMVVEKDYLKPILNKIETCSERQSARDATVAIYVSPHFNFFISMYLIYRTPDIYYVTFHERAPSCLAGAH